ncbi:MULTISPECIES: hypothetical protein [unclassified Granulicatella]|uniref:hypothetical protein n=1 Tax=unclassified Granulicatella TaxID=2630493 RepID=UPI001430D6DF|nr:MULTISPECIES: hypothetical protein [unclassified Granulicatella]MBF0780557.1 hypothetical protein [Granulicatella sp. 19428wC4_WM01]
MVWNKIKENPLKYDKQYISFNLGNVFIEHQQNKMVLTSQLKTHEIIKQVFIFEK